MVIMKNWLSNFGKDALIFTSFFFLYALLYSLAFPLVKNCSETLIQLLDIFILFFLSLWLFVIYRKKLSEQIRTLNKDFFKKLLFYIFIFVLANLVVFCINNLIYFVTQNIATNEALNQNKIATTPITSFISVCILAPFYEEILLRLNFENLFKKKWTFILTTGIFFGSLHLILLESASEFLYIIPYSILGITLSYIYKDSNSIYYSILIHALNNITQTILVLWRVFL